MKQTETITIKRFNELLAQNAELLDENTQLKTALTASGLLEAPGAPTPTPASQPIDASKQPKAEPAKSALVAVPTPARAQPSIAGRLTAKPALPVAVSKPEAPKVTANTAAEKYRSISDPKERTAYWASHRAEILGEAPDGTADRKLALRAKFAAIGNPQERAAFWSKHRDEMFS